MVTLDFLNKRLNELMAHSKMCESQLQASYGHIREVQYLISEMEKKSGEANDEKPE